MASYDFVLSAAMAALVLGNSGIASPLEPAGSAPAASVGSSAAAPAPRVVFGGRILSPDGVPVSSAHATVIAESGATAPLEVIADRDGRFDVAVTPGAYVVVVDSPGLPPLTQRVIVALGEAPSQDLVLQVGEVREAITVTASSGYAASAITTATKTDTPLLDVPQAVTVVTRELMQDQLMTSIGDVVRYVPGVTLHQGENNRDQVILRGNSTSADFFVDGVRDDVPYYRDLYNLDRVEALKGPNAMIFGRGGAGGVINRVTKEAGFEAFREVSVQGGSYDNKRFGVDLDQPLGKSLALRLNGLYEKSGSFRDGVDLTRRGLAPTLTFQPSDSTRVTLSYESFRDERVADRGITSFQGRPAGVDISTYYGNSDDARVRAAVNLGSLALEQRLGELTIKNRTLFGDYDRFYQNYVPGAASANGSTVLLTAYNNATKRRNLFNQTDVTTSLSTGSVKHTLLVGAEVGRQLTDGFKNTGYFDNASTSISVPFDSPRTTRPVTFRQSATDADNHVRTSVFALYAQDQVEISPALQLVAGVRFDRFDLAYHNNRNGDDLGRTDDLVSPRAGVVVKPHPSVSLYGSYSVTFLPSSGDQFSSLTTVTRELEPEKFRNYEVGAKWDAASALALTLAVYRLDRTNTRATDPNDPTRVVQTGSQRTNGVEIGVNGRLTSFWSAAGGYAYQDAFVTSATATAREGAHVGQVPFHTFSLWNNVKILPALGAALGVIHRTSMFATIDDSVTLPAYTRLDAAAFLTVTDAVRLQVNVENLLDARYYANADSNTNISPGAPRSVRVAATVRF